MENNHPKTLLTFTVLGGLGGLACIFDWLGVKPGDFRMTPTLPHVAWLIFGLVLFSLSISLSVISWRSNASRGELKRLRESLADSAASNLEYRGERDRAMEELRAIQNKDSEHEACIQCGEVWAKLDYIALRDRGYKCTQILSDLQIETLTIAKDLKAFLLEIGPMPEYDHWIGEPEKETENPNSIFDPWHRRYVGGYGADFAPRIKAAYHAFLKLGINQNGLVMYTESVHDLVEAEIAVDCLYALACKGSGVNLLVPERS